MEVVETLPLFTMQRWLLHMRSAVSRTRKAAALFTFYG